MQMTISSESLACKIKKTDWYKHHCITEQISRKNVSIPTVWKRLCEAGLKGRISVKKPLLRKQNNVKGVQWDKAHKDRIIEQWNKVLWIDKSMFKIFRSNRTVYVRRRIGERAAISCINPTVKDDGGSVVVLGALPIAKSGIYIRWRAKGIRPAIMRSPLERSLWVNDLYSCKIMTKSILVNFARGILKAKKNSTSFNWCLGGRNQWTYFPLNWCGMNLTEKN